MQEKKLARSRFYPRIFFVRILLLSVFSFNYVKDLALNSLTRTGNSATYTSITELVGTAGALKRSHTLNYHQ